MKTKQALSMNSSCELKKLSLSLTANILACFPHNLPYWKPERLMEKRCDKILVYVGNGHYFYSNLERN